MLSFYNLKYQNYLSFTNIIYWQWQPEQQQV